MKKIARVVKQADFISKFTEKAKELGLKLGFNADVDYSWGKDTVHTIMYEKGGTTYLVVQVIITVDEYNYIRIYDTKNNLLGEYKIRGDNFDFNVFVPILNFITDKLKEKEELLKPQKTETKEVSHETILETAEQVYDFGEENNWQGLEDKHYKILSKDKNLAQMAVADMQDKELQVPEILKKYRRYSMSFKDVLISKIAKEKSATREITKKAAEEDVKLKVQKNKPAGLDTSYPQTLTDDAREIVSNIMSTNKSIEEIKAELAAFDADTAKIRQKKIEAYGLDDKLAQLKDLTNKAAQLLEKSQNIAFNTQDKLVAFINQTKVMPAKATDKWKVEKLMEKIDKELGKGVAEQYLKNAENGLQSQATEKAIKELVIFEPTKQQKTSATNDEESSIDKLLDTIKQVYSNIRNFYLSTVKANNIVEEQLLPAVSASKKSNVSKKAEYKAEEDVLFEMMEDFEICTPEEISLCQSGWGRNIETAETMLYIRTGLRNLEQLKDDLISSGIDEETVNSYVVGDTEDTEIESKKKVNLKKAKKEFVEIKGKTWKEFLDNIKNEGYSFNEKLYNTPIGNIPEVLEVSKDGQVDKVLAFWNDDRNEYGISCRIG